MTLVLNHVQGDAIASSSCSYSTNVQMSEGVGLSPDYFVQDGGRVGRKTSHRTTITMLQVPRHTSVSGVKSTRNTQASLVIDKQLGLVQLLLTLKLSKARSYPYNAKWGFSAFTSKSRSNRLSSKTYMTSNGARKYQTKSLVTDKSVCKMSRSDRLR